MATRRGNSLDVKDGPGRVGGVLVLGGVTNQALLISEGDIRRSDTVSLVVGDDFNLSVLHHTDTRVSCSEIDTDDYCSTS